MDWQQPVALGIVALTAGIFLWRAVRPARYRLRKAVPCGCVGTRGGPKPPGLVVHSRRGEIPRVAWKP